MAKRKSGSGRRYIRDSKGRFASTGSSRIKSVRAADTRLVGRFERQYAKNPKAVMGKPRGVKRGTEIKGSVAQRKALKRIQTDYTFREKGQRKVDAAGLRSDIRLARRRKDTLTNWAGL